MFIVFSFSMKCIGKGRWIRGPERYEGEFMAGKRHGFGVQVYANSDIYSGMCLSLLSFRRIAMVVFAGCAPVSEFSFSYFFFRADTVRTVYHLWLFFFFLPFF